MCCHDTLLEPESCSHNAGSAELAGGRSQTGCGIATGILASMEFRRRNGSLGNYARPLPESGQLRSCGAGVRLVRGWVATNSDSRLSTNGLGERLVDGPGEVRLAKGFLEHDGGRAKFRDLCRIAADEDVGYRPDDQYFLHGRDAASVAQAQVDDHQIRLVAARSHDGVGFGGSNAAGMAHARQNLGEKTADHGIVFHQQDLERCQWLPPL